MHCEITLDSFLFLGKHIIAIALYNTQINNHKQLSLGLTLAAVPGGMTRN